MSRRDCGCGGLVTPTLDELLAVARNKPLPRIRERRPPPARLGASLKGWLSWRLVNRQGKEVRGGEGPNLILDQGLDLIATTDVYRELQNDGTSGVVTLFSLIAYCAVGTDSSSPTTSDTGLGSEVARTAAKFSNDTIARPADGVYQLTRNVEFDYDEANGNLTEWGFSPSSSVGSNLFNRALFLDSGGSPDTVTKTDEEKLRITYTLEVSLSPVTMTAGSFDITGVGTVNGNYMLVGGSAPSSNANPGQNRCAAPDLKWFSRLARGIGIVSTSLSQPPTSGTLWVSPTDLASVTYSTILSYTTDVANLRGPRDIGANRDEYTPGSFQRTGGTWKWDTVYGNLDPIKGFNGQGAYESFNSGLDSCAALGYVFDLDLADEFSKDDEHTLTIGVPTVTWGRAA